MAYSNRSVALLCIAEEGACCNRALPLPTAHPPASHTRPVTHGRSHTAGQTLTQSVTHLVTLSRAAAGRQLQRGAAAGDQLATQLQSLLGEGEGGGEQAAGHPVNASGSRYETPHRSARLRVCTLHTCPAPHSNGWAVAWLRHGLWPNQDGVCVSRGPPPPRCSEL
jgi:hypothetical protein